MLAMLVAACGTATKSADKEASTSSVPARAALPQLPPPARIVWTKCTSDAALQCGSVVVPVDYSHPQAGSITIAVARAPALESTGSNGTLIVNPGGPGESGNQILPVILHMLPFVIRDHFNVVSFDPRGTGASDPLECGTSGPAVVSALPVPASNGEALPGAPVFSEMARECQARFPSTLPFVNTIDTARDMDRIRQALRDIHDQFLRPLVRNGPGIGVCRSISQTRRKHGSRWCGRPECITYSNKPMRRLPAAEQSLLHLFATCRSERSCPLGPDPEEYFVRLASSLTTRPLPAPGGGDDNPGHCQATWIRRLCSLSPCPISPLRTTRRW